MYSLGGAIVVPDVDPVNGVVVVVGPVHFCVVVVSKN